MKEQISLLDKPNKIVLYTANDGKVTADVFFATASRSITRPPQSRVIFRDECG